MWYDNVNTNSSIRDFNIAYLKKLGFKNCGLYSTSGFLHIESKNYGAVIIFGISCSIATCSYIKYNSLCKKYKSKDEAEKEFQNLILQLKQKE